MTNHATNVILIAQSQQIVLMLQTCSYSQSTQENQQSGFVHSAGFGIKFDKVMLTKNNSQMIAQVPKYNATVYLDFVWEFRFNYNHRKRNVRYLILLLLNFVCVLKLYIK